MRSLLLCSALLSQILGVTQAYAAASAGPTVPLLEPFDGNPSVPVKPGFETFLGYFNSGVHWMFNVAMGICILWVLFGGFQIMLSGGDSGKRSEGIEHMTWAIAGMLMLIFAGFLLRSLNSLFFV